MNDLGPHRTVQLTIQARVPEWARWYTVDEDGGIRVWRFKPKCPAPDEGSLWYSTHPDEPESLGEMVLSSYTDINGDGHERHCPEACTREAMDAHWEAYPRVKDWKTQVFRIKKSDFR